MRILVTGSPAKNRELPVRLIGAGGRAGFTLLELLVVMLVIALVYSLASLGVSSDRKARELDTAITRLADVAEFALEEAELRGVDLGLVLQQGYGGDGTVIHYSWRERQLEGWGPMQAATDVFEARRLPVGVDLSLTLDEVDALEIPRLSEADEPSPQLVFYASGETTPGVIDLHLQSDGELLWRLQWDLLGRQQLLRGGEPAKDELL